MIKAYEGGLDIEGSGPQVLLDFAHIYQEMIHVSPEIVQAVVIRHQDDLLNAKVDRAVFATCEKILDAIISVESEDKDDESSIL